VVAGAQASRASRRADENFSCDRNANRHLAARSAPASGAPGPGSRERSDPALRPRWRRSRDSVPGAGSAQRAMRAMVSTP
jgi:hypothetical protein